MKINKGKLNLAMAILSSLEYHTSEMSNEKDIRVNVDVFSNCREQGFMLNVYTYKGSLKDMKIAFSENRNTDNIVVYHSTKSSEGYLNNFSEEFWNNSKYFKYNDIGSVVDYIVELVDNYFQFSY